MRGGIEKKTYRGPWCELALWPFQNNKSTDRLDPSMTATVYFHRPVSFNGCVYSVYTS